MIVISTQYGAQAQYHSPGSFSKARILLELASIACEPTVPSLPPLPLYKAPPTSNAVKAEPPPDRAPKCHFPAPTLWRCDPTAVSICPTRRRSNLIDLAAGDIHNPWHRRTLLARLVAQTPAPGRTGEATLAQAEAKVAEKAEVSRLVPEVVDPGEEEEAPKPAQVLPSLL